jgi:hypothetical protein
MITVQAFTPTQLIPPVPTQAFTHVVTMQVQDVTQAQSKPSDSKNQSQGRSTTHECHNWVCSPSHRSNASSCPACRRWWLKEKRWAWVAQCFDQKWTSHALVMWSTQFGIDLIHLLEPQCYFHWQLFGSVNWLSPSAQHLWFDVTNATGKGKAWQVVEWCKD